VNLFEAPIGSRVTLYGAAAPDGGHYQVVYHRVASGWTLDYQGGDYPTLSSSEKRGIPFRLTARDTEKLARGWAATGGIATSSRVAVEYRVRRGRLRLESLRNQVRGLEWELAQADRVAALEGAA
jgi:hypothetical protein